MLTNTNLNWNLWQCVWSSWPHTIVLYNISVLQICEYSGKIYVRFWLLGWLLSRTQSIQSIHQLSTGCLCDGPRSPSKVVSSSVPTSVVHFALLFALVITQPVTVTNRPDISDQFGGPKMKAFRSLVIAFWMGTLFVVVTGESNGVLSCCDIFHIEGSLFRVYLFECSKYYFDQFVALDEIRRN